VTDTKNNTTPDDAEERDGRRRRRVASRRAITEAMISLIEEGVMEPTAAQVSKRANVGMRTVFRHFNDMETLFGEVTEILSERVRDHFTYVSQEKDLDARLRDVIDKRAELFERIENLKLSTRVWLHKSAHLRQDDIASRKILYVYLKQSFPEMNGMDETKRRAVGHALGFDGWLGNRFGSGLSVDQTKEVIFALVRPQFD